MFMIWDVAPSCSVTQHVLPDPHLPRQNLADSGMTKIIVDPTNVPDHHCHLVLSFWSGPEDSLEALLFLFRFCVDFLKSVEDLGSRSTCTPTSDHVVLGSVPRVLSKTFSKSNRMLCSLTAMASEKIGNALHEGILKLRLAFCSNCVRFFDSSQVKTFSDSFSSKKWVRKLDLTLVDSTRLPTVPTLLKTLSGNNSLRCCLYLAVVPLIMAITARQKMQLSVRKVSAAADESMAEAGTSCLTLVMILH